MSTEVETGGTAVDDPSHLDFAIRITDIENRLVAVHAALATLWPAPTRESAQWGYTQSIEAICKSLIRVEEAEVPEGSASTLFQAANRIRADADGLKALTDGSLSAPKNEEALVPSCIVNGCSLLLRDIAEDAEELAEAIDGRDIRAELGRKARTTHG